VAQGGNTHFGKSRNIYGLRPWSTAEIFPAPDAEPFASELCCPPALGEDWAVITQRGRPEVLITRYESGAGHRYRAAADPRPTDLAGAASAGRSTQDAESQ
jgi:hypothetical protein